MTLTGVIYMNHLVVAILLVKKMCGFASVVNKDRNLRSEQAVP